MTDFDMAETGKRIRELRIGLSMSQSDLADRVGVAQNTISQYENGLSELSMAVLFRIAQALETTSDYLLGISDY